MKLVRGELHVNWKTEKEMEGCIFDDLTRIEECYYLGCNAK
jgi:hypothetical protein